MEIEKRESSNVTRLSQTKAQEAESATESDA